MNCCAKKRSWILLLGLFAFIFGSGVTAQNFNFNHPTDTLLLYTPSTDYLTSHLSNSTIDTIEVDIIRLINEMPQDTDHTWLSGLCVGICSPPNIDSIRIAIPADTTIDYRMFFGYLGDEVFDTAHTQILFKNVNNPSNYFVQNYYATLDPWYFSVSEIPNSNHVIYPNPATDHLYFKPQTDYTVSRLKIIDLSGKIWLNNYIPDNKNVLDISNLPSGIYLLLIEDAGYSTMFSQRFIKN